ncbi:MAG: hypothetical protein A3G81_19540 [Betaproteobacteria bacterium RIFCSPLOWO2_12_FULL_65_14]|nr:MAG: hypothetical protein A3G81_19540 [Betaproteobacteria bacterium RIFCSPLOWO2_12_FULL_65_14]
MRAALPALLAGLVTASFAGVVVAFVWQPGLASFADDSVSYLVMAQVFSPWQAASPPIAEAFAREAFYPPLYPLLLALLGAAHDIAQAQVVTALLLAACLPLVYLLGTRWLGDKWAAAGATAVTALLPSLWIHVKGTLSEPLFALVLLATLYLAEVEHDGQRRRWPVAAAMAALVLTRTVGVIVVAAYAACALLRRDRPVARALLPVLAAAVAYGAWVLVRPAQTSDVNVSIALEYLRTLSFEGFAGILARQANSIAEAWTGALLLFWVEDRPLRVVLAGAVGVLALTGMALRFMARKPDAWMSAAYLATFLVWPFQDQMTRFLFPALPVLVLYAFWVPAAGLRRLRRPVAPAHALVAILIASLAAPGLAFIHQRAQAEGPYVEMTDWYRRPDLDDARRRAAVHLDLLADMQAIRALTMPEDRVMWVAPSYIALLADRRGVAAPPAELAPAAYRVAVEEAAPDFVFLSIYHPRDTIRDAAWQAGMRALRGYGAVVHARTRPDGSVSSVLLRLRPREAALWRAAR